jgi:hypothetical protein
MSDSDDRRDLEGDPEDPVAPGGTGATGGQSHGEDLGMHLEHDAEDHTETEPDGADGGRDQDEVVPFDKESRLSDVGPEDQLGPPG